MEEGKLELTWVGKDRRLLSHGDDRYEWVDPADWRVSEIRLLHDVDTVGDADVVGPPPRRPRPRRGLNRPKHPHPQPHPGP